MDIIQRHIRKCHTQPGDGLILPRGGLNPAGVRRGILLRKYLQLGNAALIAVPTGKEVALPLRRRQQHFQAGHPGRRADRRAAAAVRCYRHRLSGAGPQGDTHIVNQHAAAVRRCGCAHIQRHMEAVYASGEYRHLVIPPLAVRLCRGHRLAVHKLIAYLVRLPAVRPVDGAVIHIQRSGRAQRLHRIPEGQGIQAARRALVVRQQAGIAKQAVAGQLRRSRQVGKPHGTAAAAAAAIGDLLDRLHLIQIGIIRAWIGLIPQGRFVFQLGLIAAVQHDLVGR